MKNDNYLFFQIPIKGSISPYQIISTLLQKAKIAISHCDFSSDHFSFIGKKEEENKTLAILDSYLISYSFHPVSRISLIGNGIMSNHILEKVFKIVGEKELILKIENTETKLSITFSDVIDDEIANKLHDAFVL